MLSADGIGHIHQYSGVDRAAVRLITRRDLPAVERRIQEIQEAFG